MLGFGRMSKYRKARGGMSNSQLVAMGYGMGLMHKKKYKARGDGRRRRRYGGFTDLLSGLSSRDLIVDVDKPTKLEKLGPLGAVAALSGPIVRGISSLHGYVQKNKPVSALLNKVPVLGRIPILGHALRGIQSTFGYGRRAARRKYRR